MLPPDEFKSIRQLIWLYFWLLIFEGVLRKWVVPSLSSVLRRARDPVAHLMTLLDRLDAFALAAQRAVTVPLLRQMLEEGATPGAG